MSAIERSLYSFMLRNHFSMRRTADAQSIQGCIKSIRAIATNHPLIRIGGEADGGYLIPDDLEGIDTCFSPGVSTVADFETDLTQRGIKCFLADASVDAPPVKNSSFDFEKKFLGAQNGGQYMTLENWIARKAPGKTDFILQMDIEGAEYSVIYDSSVETLRKFRILVIEFHSLSAIYDRVAGPFIFLTFQKLLKDFEIVHIHPNNGKQPIRYRNFEVPPLMEFTFLRKDRIREKHKSVEFPHKLDRKNVPSKSDVVLPECWRT